MPIDKGMVVDRHMPPIKVVAEPPTEIPQPPTFVAGMQPAVCRVNRCGRPLGIGTHMSITGYGRASDQDIPVCEDHWQALRDVLPVASTVPDHLPDNDESRGHGSVR